MKTLSPTRARQNLTSVLERVRKGEDVGILHNGEVYAIRRVRVLAEDDEAGLPSLEETPEPGWDEIMAPVYAATQARTKGRPRQPSATLADRERRRR